MHDDQGSVLRDFEVAVMPAQMLGPIPWTPCHYLLAAILDEAKEDLTRKPPTERYAANAWAKVRTETLAWVCDPNDYDGFSFPYVCTALHLDVDAVRRELLIVAHGGPRTNSRTTKNLHGKAGRWLRKLRIDEE